jgi:hypothetical protein
MKIKKNIYKIFGIRNYLLSYIPGSQKRYGSNAETSKSEYEFG